MRAALDLAWLSRAAPKSRQEMREKPGATDNAAEALGSDALRAMYDESPVGVLFTVPDGRVLAANPAACEVLGRSEAETCRLGRQGIADDNDKRWAQSWQSAKRTGHVHGVARMIRGDGTLIEVEMNARIFTDANGEKRSCTIVHDVTDRVKMERQLVEMSHPTARADSNR